MIFTVKWAKIDVKSWDSVETSNLVISACIKDMTMIFCSTNRWNFIFFWTEKSTTSESGISEFTLSEILKSTCAQIGVGYPAACRWFGRIFSVTQGKIQWIYKFDTVKWGEVYKHTNTVKYSEISEAKNLVHLWPVVSFRLLLTRSLPSRPSSNL